MMFSGAAACVRGGRRTVMAIQDLLQLVPPPADPLENGPRTRWDFVQQELGLQLPMDFREIGAHYGTGRFGFGLEVLNVFSKSFRDQLDNELSRWLELKELEGEEELTYSIFPEAPGLLAWGSDDQSSGLFWMTEGLAENWPIIVRGHGNPVYERFDLPLTTFLTELLTQKIAL